MRPGGPLDRSSFLVQTDPNSPRRMTKEKLEMIVATLELLLVTLKEELKEQPELPYEEVVSYLNEDDVDEYYEEDLDV